MEDAATLEAFAASSLSTMPALPTAQDKVTLAGGAPTSQVLKLPRVEMPRIGLGTWMSTGQECYEMVLAALRVGFRHIDTSENCAPRRPRTRPLDISPGAPTSIGAGAVSEGHSTPVVPRECLRSCQRPFVQLT